LNHNKSYHRQHHKANEAQDIYITNPNMKAADAYIQALQETTMTFMGPVLVLAGSEFPKLTRGELKANPGGKG
tara:strand:+ start:44 stop:262 length:219 start_codon:yes stop_codon:yes gene_type:complete